jgi:hypothetical protein
MHSTYKQQRQSVTLQKRPTAALGFVSFLIARLAPSSLLGGAVATNVHSQGRQVIAAGHI